MKNTNYKYFLNLKPIMIENNNSIKQNINKDESFDSQSQVDLRDHHARDHNLATPITATYGLLPNYPSIHPIKNFSIGKKENLEDWLRNLKMILRLNKNLQNTLHIYAVSMLTDEAGQWYDNLTIEPKNWTEFEDMVTQRFGKNKNNRAALLRETHTRMQKDQETIQVYAETMIN